MNIDAIAVRVNSRKDINGIVEVPIGGEPIKYDLSLAAQAFGHLN